MAWAKPMVEIAEPPDDHFCQTTVLMRAVRGGAHRQVKFLLEQGCDPNTAGGARGTYPLMMACYIPDPKKQLLIVNFLLHCGADPSLCDGSSRSSLMYACTVAPEGVVKAMVHAADYNLNAVDVFGNTALHYAAVAGRVNVQSVLVRELQRLRLDLSKRNELFLTPLSAALLGGKVECAKALYDAGASPRFSVSDFHRILARISENRPIYRIIYQDLSDSAAVQDAFCTNGSGQSEVKCKISWQQFLQCMGEETDTSLSAKGQQRADRGRTHSLSLPSIHQPSASLFDSSSRRSSTVELPLSARNQSHKVSSRNTFSSTDKAQRRSGCHTPSSLEMYHSLMTSYYPIMNSPLFCPQPKEVAEINSEWIEAVHRSFFTSKKSEAFAGSPTGVPRHRKLTRMSSSSSTPRSAGDRSARKLSRMTTSPAFSFH